MRLHLIPFAIIFAFCPAAPRVIAAPPPAVVTGDLRQWGVVTLTFDGPVTTENATVNPFKDYRLDVVFAQRDRTIRVPGYYAADGSAARTGAYDGGKWRVHFVPDAPGTWQYRAEFAAGANIAVSEDPSQEGTATAFDDSNGRFTVQAADPKQTGPLQAAPGRYPRFAGGRYFLRAGTASPSNLLAYYEFDQTRPTHQYLPHQDDWRQGDPLWRGGRGKNIIGGINYLSGKGMNALAFSVMNLRGAGNDVWPWTSEDERYRFDCSKLDEWETVLTHMDRLGLGMRLITQEGGNDHLLDGGFLGLQRKLYYRELVARFAHHRGLTWDLGEGITNEPVQIKSFAEYIRRLDPWDHPIVLQPAPSQLDAILNPLLGAPAIDGILLPIPALDRVYTEVLRWVRKSERTGRPWSIWPAYAGPARRATPPDILDPGHDALRRDVLWGSLMAGGAGAEWRFGTDFAQGGLTCESWRSRETLWDATRHALELFRDHLQMELMAPHDELAVENGAHCLAIPGQLYAIYLPGGGRPLVQLGGVTSSFTVDWFNPRTGGPLEESSVKTVQGPGRVMLGINLPDPGNEWVVVVKRLN